MRTALASILRLLLAVLVLAGGEARAQILDLPPFMAIDWTFDVRYGSVSVAAGDDSSMIVITNTWGDDIDKRKAMIPKAEEILENDPPLVPVAWEQIYDAFYNRVHGQNATKFFGIYDVTRWDTVWMAQS